MFEIKFDSAQPIYAQIIEGIKKAVARGSLHPGDKLPSQRDLAVSLGVNPNTVQRAYRELEQIGLTETLRGQGTFLKQDHDMMGQIRSEMINATVEIFIAEMKSLGCHRDDIISTVNRLLTESV